MFDRNLTTVSRAATFGLLVLFACNVTNAREVTIQIQNLQAVDGFYFTPVWVGVHDGSFDVYTSGEPAANFPGLEEIAEGGDTAPLSADFNTGGGVDATITSPGGFAGAPVFDPGETVNFTLDVPDPSVNRYFSYASMVIPSNDAFFANGEPMANMLFDAAGNFAGPLTIDVRGQNVIDAGTEVNDVLGGAAFSVNGGISADQNGLIGAHPGLDDFLGTGTAAGTTLGSSLGADTLLARITVIPEPSTAMMTVFGTVFIGLLRRRRHVG